MLPDYLQKFNQVLEAFNQHFPSSEWSEDFKNSLLNDFTFFSSRIEDEHLKYGDTIRFLKEDVVGIDRLKSYFDVAQHQVVLKALLDDILNFEFSEKIIKDIHRNLMNNPHSWDSEFSINLVGEYRDFQVIGKREPYFEDKEYLFFSHIEISMASYIGVFYQQFNNIDNQEENKHVLTRLAFFHNIFLNKIHPFADGNGRVCRIIMGAVMMKANIPPIFPEIINFEDNMEYIKTIIACEASESDKPFVEYLAKGLSNYMLKRIQEII